jgi:Calx-beta domain-containing protein
VQNGYPLDIPDPGPAALSIADAAISMGYTGTATLIMRVSLGPIIGSSVAATYQTADGTAINGQNYVLTSGSLFFDPWTTTQTIRIPIIGVASPPKNFTVTLSSPAGAILTNATATATINYDSDIIFRNDFE